MRRAKWLNGTVIPNCKRTGEAGVQAESRSLYIVPLSRALAWLFIGMIAIAASEGWALAGYMGSTASEPPSPGERSVTEGQSLNAARNVDYFLHEAFAAPSANAERALYQLQRDGANSVVILKERYANIPETAYYKRWVLVHALAVVGHPSATDFLRDLVNRPLPRDPSAKCHHRCPRDEELTVRFAALDGLGLLFYLGEPRASQVLLDLLRGPTDRALKAEAVQVYLQFARNRDEARRTIREALPPHELHLLEIKPLRGKER